MAFTVTSVILRDFRSYDVFELRPSADLTILVGPNATGKTNLIEAIELMTEADSFRRPQWAETIRWGSERAHLALRAQDEERLLEIDLVISEAGRRSYKVNGKPRKSVSDVAGILPCVVFTPDDLRIVKDSAERRRAALDGIGVQLSQTYGRLKSEYEKVVRQRNALLKQERVDEDAMASWDERLISLGARLVTHRAGLFEKVAAHLSEIHLQIAGSGAMGATYVPSWVRDGGDLPVSEAAQALEIHMSQKRPEERLRGVTLVGPHRDEITFSLDGRDARDYASQGQMRTIALALKLAEVAVVSEVSGKKPLLLLDDVMSELDGERRGRLAEMVGDSTQTFVTTTNLGYFEPELIDRALVVELA